MFIDNNRLICSIGADENVVETIESLERDNPTSLRDSATTFKDFYGDEIRIGMKVVCWFADRDAHLASREVQGIITPSSGGLFIYGLDLGEFESDGASSDGIPVGIGFLTQREPNPVRDSTVVEFPRISISDGSQDPHASSDPGRILWAKSPVLLYDKPKITFGAILFKRSSDSMIIEFVEWTPAGAKLVPFRDKYFPYAKNDRLIFSSLDESDLHPYKVQIGLLPDYNNDGMLDLFIGTTQSAVVSLRRDEHGDLYLDTEASWYSGP